MEILIYSILPTIFATLISLYLTEKIKGKIKNSFDLKLENIKKEHSLQTSKFQAEINSLKVKENYKFTKLHEKRFLVLETIYQLINKTLSNLSNYVEPGQIIENGLTYDQHLSNLHSEFLKAHNEFTTFFLNNKIYFDKELENLIEKYLIEIREIYSDFYTVHFYRIVDDNPDRETRMKGYTAYKRIPEKLSPIKIEIENSFRNLLEN